MKKLEGQITISRTTCSHEGDYISIGIRDKISATPFCDVRVDFSEFAQALTGLSHQRCQFELRWVENVGKRLENKVEIVFVPDIKSFDKTEMLANARAALAPLEVDGWKGSANDATNHHHVVRREKDGTWYRVGFSRFVEAE